MSTGTFRSPRRCAFTLVELLVVIGIIALLISVLLPALARARASAADLKCKSNLRSIGQAFAIYANRYGGRLPPSEMCDQSYSVADVTVDHLNIFWFERLMGEKLIAMPSPGAENGVLVCPSQDPVLAIGRARGKAPPADDARVGRFKLSYGINNFMSISDWKGSGTTIYVPDGIDDDIGPGKTKDFGGTPMYPKIWSTRNSSEKVVLADARNGFQLHHFLPNNIVANTNNIIDWPRHSMPRAKLGRANFLFADGHVASLSQGLDNPGVFNEVCAMNPGMGDAVFTKAKLQWTANGR